MMDKWSERGTCYRAEFALRAEEVADMRIMDAEEQTTEIHRRLRPLSRCRCHLPESVFGMGETHAIFPTLQYWKAKLWQQLLDERPAWRRKWERFARMSPGEQRGFLAEIQSDWFGEGGTPDDVRGGIMGTALKRVSELQPIHFEQCPEYAQRVARAARARKDEEAVAQGGTPFSPTKSW